MHFLCRFIKHGNVHQCSSNPKSTVSSLTSNSPCSDNNIFFSMAPVALELFPFIDRGVGFRRTDDDLAARRNRDVNSGHTWLCELKWNVKQEGDSRWSVIHRRAVLTPGQREADSHFFSLLAAINLSRRSSFQQAHRRGELITFTSWLSAPLTLLSPSCSCCLD